MISKVISALPFGYEGKTIVVEGDTNRGLPSFNIIGMVDKTINEARERIRAAIANSGFRFPDKRLTINLAPAELKKAGSYLDVPIAIAILVLSKQLLQEDASHRLFVGELSLNGDIRPIKGIINIVEQAEKENVKEIILPFNNYHQANIVAKNIKVIPVKNLIQLYKYLKAQIEITYPQAVVKKSKTSVNVFTLDQIKGQEQAKRALIIAIAGHHNLLISGPPGTGKSMLAKTACNLLPTLNVDEQIQVTKIHALSISNSYDIISHRPFRSPHHSISQAALIGGGNNVLPGEISLAHLGILFLDELPEFRRDSLEALRQPLEDRIVKVNRANQKATYPANFILVGTMNPCPCGYYQSTNHECNCSPNQIMNYRKKISGPLLDRFDLTINVNHNPISELVKNTTGNSEHQRAQVAIVRATITQHNRYNSEILFNSNLSSFQTTKLHMDKSAQDLLRQAAEKLNLSARTYFKTIKVAQTISDLDQQEMIQKSHIAEALQYRQIESRI